MKNTIKEIVDQIVALAKSDNFTHPDPVSCIHAVSMLVDAEIIKRMKEIRENE